MMCYDWFSFISVCDTCMRLCWVSCVCYTHFLCSRRPDGLIDISAQCGLHFKFLRLFLSLCSPTKTKKAPSSPRNRLHPTSGRGKGKSKKLTADHTPRWAKRRRNRFRENQVSSKSGLGTRRAKPPCSPSANQNNIPLNCRLAYRRNPFRRRCRRHPSGPRHAK